MRHGIRCSRRTGHVVKLNLRNPIDLNDDLENYYIHILRGELSDSLHNLNHLTYLDLSMNNFEAEIPDFLGSLVNLRYLNLSYSSFTGKLPHHLRNLSSLQYLDLSNFGGLQNIGSLWWVSQLYSLKHLDLSNVDLSGDTNWFPAINMLPSLLVLNLGGCNLYNIPAHISINFTSLVSPDLSNNYRANVTTVPSWLSNITGLVKLNLNMNKYGGPVPESIGTLRFSPSWIFLNNSFTAFLPTTLSKLSKLRNLHYLDLSDNEFLRPVPTEMSNLTQLRYINLHDNKLTGNLPSFIAQLSKLESLNMGGNAISGIIDENYFNNLLSLTYLDLSSNSGVVTNFSSTRTPPFQLVYLRLSSCKVGPRFPPWLHNQRNLNFLKLYNASIADNIPHWFSSLNVQILHLSNNKLTGNLVIHSNLEYLFVSNNLFSKLMVANGYNSFSLKILYASNNLLTGAFPRWLCNMKSINVIDLSNIQLSGRLPSCLGSLNLAALDLTNNSFSVSVPKCLGSLAFLQSLRLRNNKFEGHLLSSFQNLTGLDTLDVCGNAITGIIPPWIGENLSNLMVLSLQSNRFHGPIPQLFCQLSHLQTLNLARNNISGSIPSCFRNLTAMIVNQNLDVYFFEEKILEHMQTVERLYTAKYFISVDLSNNKLTGVIPTELMELLELVKLNLSGNHLEGRIPEQICNLRQLQSLDLSRSL